MADKKFIPLIEIGPSHGMDSSSAGDFVAIGDGAYASNISANRVNAGLTTERGRTNIVTYVGQNAGLEVVTVVPYVATSTDEWIVGVFESPTGAYSVIYYDGTTTQSFPIIFISASNTTFFDSAVQFYGNLYTNNGYQYSAQYPTQFFQWQYPPPNPGSTGANPLNPIFSSGPTSPITAGTPVPTTVYFAFTRVVTPGSIYVPSKTYPFVQETTAIGNNATTGSSQLYPYAVTVTNTATTTTYSNVTSNNWTGQNADGSYFVTNVYVQDNLTPVWYLAGTMRINGVPLSVLNAGAYAAGQQLVAHDVPPAASNNLCVIFTHLERTWNFAYVVNAATAYQPQSQLWYSDLGTPWSFDQVNQVLLVGNSATPPVTFPNVITQPVLPSYTGYGDPPIAGLSMGALAILFKKRSIWGLFGNDTDSFVVTRLFDIGCISRRSAISALGQVWWLAESGAYTYNGSAPQYLSEKIKATLSAIPYADQQNAISLFRGRTWYISFPATGITLCYYTTTGDWYTLPYSTSAGYFVQANQNGTGNAGEIVAGRYGYTSAIDRWLSAESDFGMPIIGTWTSPLTSSAAPGTEKEFEFITVVAPYQTGTCSVTLTIDPGSATPKVFTQTFDLSSNSYTTRHIVRLGPDFKGFQAQLSVTATATSGNSPVTLYAVTAWGVHGRHLVVPT